MSDIHSTAIIAPTAKLGKGVKIGPYSLIEDNVVIGDDSEVGDSVRILEHTEIGHRCQVHHGSVIGGVPQDKKFKGELTKTIIGDDNIIREYVTINRGTEGGGSKTQIGDRNLIMSYVHIAHDCILGNDIILASYTALTGHVQVDDFAATSGMVGIHHFCRLGKMSYIGGMSKVTQDVPPYVMADGNPCRNRGLNLVALRRQTTSPGAIAALKETYRVLFLDKKGNLADIIQSFKESEEFSFPEVQNLVRFIEERSKNTKARYLENFRGNQA